ncbi:ClcB-like voltage-gated chloride channel protein [Paludibacterium sp.]|uniref:ClcB-like voltage-gated chloride channel protein n=2 Tax=Paludibacterium sp. TaxID=1917523 RepID=UPI0025D4C9B2|nr:ClcB-like voltage-gated chloride channel protein [Paludibacterium sp.]MBV8647313.1 ClcB-like voltage-gated chloride channel protein [Paludibacterium sp.]
MPPASRCRDRFGGIALNLLFAVPIGILAAGVTGVFRRAIDLSDQALFGSSQDITHIVARLPSGWRLAVPALGGLLAGIILWLVNRRYDKVENDYMEAVSSGDGRIALMPSLLRSLSSLASIVSAGSIGREGAMVQLAALTGSLTGRRWANERQLKLMTACGAAAGLASVYHTPLAGAMFVAEIVLGAITVDLLIPLFASSVAASLTMLALSNHDAPFALVSGLASPGLGEYVLVVPLGLAAGVLAPLFLRLLAFGKRQFRALPLALPWRMALGGLLMGGIAVWVPEVCGNGYAPIIGILQGQALSVPVPLALLAKIAATALIVGAGAVGGIFTPSLFIGAALGAMVAGAAALIPALPQGDATLIALIGMGAFMAAVSHAPLMAILMVFEMTMNAQLLLPLMAGSILAYAVSRALRSRSLYDVLNRRHAHQAKVQALPDTELMALLEPVIRHLTPATTIDQACRQFEQTRTRYLYVVDEAGQFLGAVSIHQLAALICAAPERREAPVGPLIETAFDLLPAHASLKDAWSMFAMSPLERIPVVDNLDHRRFLGVVSKRNVLDRLRLLAER